MLILQVTFNQADHLRVQKTNGPQSASLSQNVIVNINYSDENSTQYFFSHRPKFMYTMIRVYIFFQRFFIIYSLLSVLLLNIT